MTTEQAQHLTRTSQRDNLEEFADFFQSMRNKLNTPKSFSRHLNYKLKLSFDSTRGIESFLSSVESYAEAYNVDEKSD